MDVQVQVVRVNEIDQTFWAIRIWVNRNASNHQCTECGLWPVVVTIEARSWGDGVLLLTNKVLSQQSPSAKSANTKRWHFCSVFHGSRNVLQDVLTGWVDVTSVINLRFPPGVSITIDVAVGSQIGTIVNRAWQSDELLGVRSVVVQRCCHRVHHHIGRIIHTRFDQRNDCCVLLNRTFHPEEWYWRDHQLEVELSVVSTLLDRWLSERAAVI